MAGSAVNAAWQVPLVGPPAHAVVSVSRFAFEQTFCVAAMMGSVVAAEQNPYGAGQVVCWSLHWRGDTRPSQKAPLDEQSLHAAPP